MQTSAIFRQNYQATSYVVVNQGGTSSGKTYAIIQVLFCLACKQPKQTITVVGQDVPNLKAGALRDAMNIYHGSAALQRMVKSYNRTDRVFEFTNGSGGHITNRSRTIKKTSHVIMSLKSILNKIWTVIKSLFDDMPAKLRTAIHIGVLVTENIKKFSDSSGADILTAIIPGDIDDKIKLMLRQQLPIILAELKLADNCGDISDPETILPCAVKVLQDMDGNVKNAFLHNLSVMVAQVASDGKLSWGDGVYLLQWYYQHWYKDAV